MRRARLGGVRITVPARLHLGFLDLEGGLGRRFGSLGITLDGPHTRLRLSPATALSVTGPDAERAGAYLRLLAEHFELDGGLNLEIEEAIPAHAGLGSGTQLALATGTAVCRLFDLDVEAVALAQLLDRGARSGIGLGAFLSGGVLLDGGRGGAERPPPILSRLAFPDDWRILLIYDRSAPGVHGAAEIAAFQRLPAFPAESAAHLCRLAVMAALPALAEGDIDGFGAAVAELQRTIGDHFAPAQGGRFASPKVAEVLAWLEGRRIKGVGQSSWGPTGFGLIAGATQGQGILDELRGLWPATTGLDFELRQGRNFGAEVEVEKAVRAAP